MPDPCCPPVRDAPPPASHVIVTAASAVPLALAPVNASHVDVVVTAASAVPRVTVASLAAPAVAVTAASEGKQTHKYQRRLQQTG
ncbi:Hypp1891 [Branchiostoma lanceolatum]|uniref:Hypp1891 protein n=1 Tax=Branchiostoma lanceolatum TaxID=7740 RepID=A0A8J9ZLR4_BRALA|nr:Hypp1891 [Branchiostoma lanceolatum]